MKNLENERVKDGELSIIEETEAFYEISFNKKVITKTYQKKKTS